MSEKIRIDKLLSGANLGSRKDVGIRIRKGSVTVNGEKIKKVDYKVDTETDIVLYDGVQIGYQKFMYIMMNKPAGVLSATEDKHAETVLDLIPAELKSKGLFPAGRLDKDTTGLLIITNDGEMAHKMLSPKSHVYKLYEAGLDNEINDEDIKAFTTGIQSGGINFLPAELWCEDEDNKKRVRVRIREGKFHQVKKMFIARGKEVQKLTRLQIGELKLDSDLLEGECRKVTVDELNLIFL